MELLPGEGIPRQRALGLYIRAGMRPWWPLLYVEIPAGALGAPDTSFRVRPADVEETTRWSIAWSRSLPGSLRGDGDIDDGE